MPRKSPIVEALSGDEMPVELHPARRCSALGAVESQRDHRPRRVRYFGRLREGLDSVHVQCVIELCHRHRDFVDRKVIAGAGHLGCAERPKDKEFGGPRRTHTIAGDEFDDELFNGFSQSCRNGDCEALR